MKFYHHMFLINLNAVLTCTTRSKCSYDRFGLVASSSPLASLSYHAPSIIDTPYLSFSPLGWLVTAGAIMLTSMQPFHMTIIDFGKKISLNADNCCFTSFTVSGANNGFQQGVSGAFATLIALKIGKGFSFLVVVASREVINESLIGLSM